MSVTRDPRSGPFVRAAEAPVEVTYPGITRQVIGFGSALMICRVTFDEGAIGTAHSHPHSQSSYVESGRFLVRVGDREVELMTGDGFFVDPHVEHGAVCLESGVLIDTFSPAREDFLSSQEG